MMKLLKTIGNNNTFLPQITDNTERLRRGMSDRLRTDVKNGQRPQFERRIYIGLPLEEDHKDYVLGERGKSPE